LAKTTSGIRLLAKAKNVLHSLPGGSPKGKDEPDKPDKAQVGEPTDFKQEAGGQR